MDCSLPGSSVHGISQARILEWVAIFYDIHNYIGGGNGNPLQYSCLETPMDGVAWWAAVYGVAQSWT